MATYSYKGYDFEVDHEPTEEEFGQMSQYVDTLPVKKQADWVGALKDPQFYKDMGNNAIGVAEVGAQMATSILPTIYGGVRGVGSLLAGEGVEKATERVQDAQKSNFGFGEYKPMTQRGGEYIENTSKAMNKPVELAGDFGEKIGGNEGRYVGELLAGTAMEFLPLTPFAAKGKGRMKPFKSKDAPAAPSMDKLEKAMENAVKEVDSVMSEPIVDTRPSEQLSREAYDSAMREQQLQRESAFNRHENFPEMVKESPMDRMVRDLGGEPDAPAPKDTPMSRMAEDLTIERSTPDQRMAQDTIEARQAAMELDMKKQATLELNAADRARQEQAPATSPEQARLNEENAFVSQAREAEAQRLQETQSLLDMEQRALDESQLMEHKRREIQKELDARQAQLERDVEVQRNRDLEARVRAMDDKPPVLTPDVPPTNRKQKPIGKRGFANKQTGAVMLPFGKKRGSLPDQIDAVQKQIDELGRRYINNGLSFEDFSSENHKLIGEKISLERELSKYQEGKPASGVEDIYPGYKIIPEGTVVMAKNGLKYPEPTRGTVVGTHGFRVGDKAYNLPVVDFGDGFPRKILPSDISEVFGGPRDPFKGPGKNQAGAIRLPFGKKPAVDQLKKVAGIKENLRNVFPEGQSVEAVIKEHGDKKTPDIDQNAVQRLFNHLTKGSLYMALKTDNPIIRVTGEKIRNATNQAMEATGRLIHNNLAPKAQALSTKERTDVWALQQIAEAKKFTLTPEFMREQGFNQKQIDWVTSHQGVMKDMYGRLTDAMKAAGVKPVSEQVAYLASRARGDFRKLVMLDDKVVGILGANTRGGLNKQVDRLLKEYPQYKVGEERYYGGRGAKGTEEGFMQMLDFLSKEDPLLKDFVKHVNDMLSQDAFNYMNAKSHTKQKKGVFGMEGRKLYSDAAENAKEGMQAQIRYAETMIKWGEYSKAIAELKPLLKADNGLDMPMAKKWANEYIQGALGNSPGKFGAKLDEVVAAAGQGTGIGTSIPAKAMSGLKQYVNGVLLGFVNPGFLLVNAIQAPRNMPEMAMWLKTKGVDAGVDIGLGRALFTMQKQLLNQKLSPLEQQASDYARANHAYSSHLFESGNSVSKDLTYYWQKGTQYIASGLERETRKMTYFAYVHMLDASGVKPSDGMFAAAQNLTDMHMNNYAQAEAPRVYQETGGVGRTAYNLMSFKHNELSRLSMLAREVGTKKEARPILVAMASQVAFAGLLGTIGFAEADEIFKKITGMYGEPQTLTKMLLDNPEISDQLKFGIGNIANVDITGRMAMQVVPDSAFDLLAPGYGKAVNVAKAGYEAVTDPSLYNSAKFAKEALPLSVSGAFDSTVFGKDDLAHNTNKVSATAQRNDADKLWKVLGLTGINESTQKKLTWENQRIDDHYKAKRNSVIDAAIKEFYMTDKLPDDWVEKFVEYQGDPKEAGRIMKDRIEALDVDRPTRELMKNAASKSVTSQHKLLRRLGLE